MMFRFSTAFSYFSLRSVPSLSILTSSSSSFLSPSFLLTPTLSSSLFRSFSLATNQRNRGQARGRNRLVGRKGFERRERRKVVEEEEEEEEEEDDEEDDEEDEFDEEGDVEQETKRPLSTFNTKRTLPSLLRNHPPPPTSSSSLPPPPSINKLRTTTLTSSALSLLSSLSITNSFPADIGHYTRSSPPLPPAEFHRITARLLADYDAALTPAHYFQLLLRTIPTHSPDAFNHIFALAHENYRTAQHFKSISSSASPPSSSSSSSSTSSSPSLPFLPSHYSILIFSLAVSHQWGIALDLLTSIFPSYSIPITSSMYESIIRSNAESLKYDKLHKIVEQMKAQKLEVGVGVLAKTLFEAGEEMERREEKDKEREREKGVGQKYRERQQAARQKRMQSLLADLIVQIKLTLEAPPSSSSSSPLSSEDIALSISACIKFFACTEARWILTTVRKLSNNAIEKLKEIKQNKREKEVSEEERRKLEFRKTLRPDVGMYAVAILATKMCNAEGKEVEIGKQMREQEEEEEDESEKKEGNKAKEIDWSNGWSWLSELRSYGFYPSQRILNHLFHTATDWNTAVALRELVEMIQKKTKNKSSLQVNEWCYRGMFDAIRKTNTQAQHQQSSNSALQYDRSSSHLVVEWDEVASLWEALLRTQSPSSPSSFPGPDTCYSYFTLVCSYRPLSYALTWFSFLPSSMVKPTTSEGLRFHLLLLRLCIKEKEWKQVEKRKNEIVRALFEKDRGVKSGDMIVTMYTQMISACAVPAQPSRALNLMNELQSLDSASFNASLTTSSSSSSSFVSSSTSSSVSSPIRINVICWTSLLDVLSLCGEYQSAVDVYNQMCEWKRNYVVPNMQTYATMLLVWCGLKRWERAREILVGGSEQKGSGGTSVNGVGLRVDRRCWERVRETLISHGKEVERIVVEEEEKREENRKRNEQDQERVELKEEEDNESENESTSSSSSFVDPLPLHPVSNYSVLVNILTRLMSAKGFRSSFSSSSAATIPVQNVAAGEREGGKRKKKAAAGESTGTTYERVTRQSRSRE